MTVANLGIAVESAEAKQGVANLDALTGAAYRAEAAVEELGAGSRATAGAVGQLNAATEVEAAVQTKATATARMHAAALQAEAQAARMANAQRTNLMFQLQDIGVSLASGMNPLMVAAQQGSQVSMIYGGLGKALQETAKMAAGFVTRFWPVAAVVGAVSAAFAGLTREINKTAETQVTFGDTFAATMQLAGESVARFFAPAVDQVVSWFGQFWDWIAPGLKFAGNAIIGTFVKVVKDVGALWEGLPPAIAEVTVNMSNVIKSGFEAAINMSVDLMNDFIDESLKDLKKLGVALPHIGYVNFGPPAANPFTGANDRLGQRLGQNALDQYSTDYMGQAFDAISTRAQSLARARKEADALGGAATGANRSLRDLARDGVTAVITKAQEFADALRGSLKDAWTGMFADARANMADGQNWFEAWANAGISAIEKLANKAADFLASAAFDSLFGGGKDGGGGFDLIGSLVSAFGGGTKLGPKASATWTDLFGNAKGNVFGAGTGLSAYSNSVVNMPTLFPFARGMGLMGEAGPEAIMPLRRGPDGRLGVAAANNNQSPVVLNYAPVNDLRGADAGAVARLEYAQAKQAAEFEARVIGVIKSGSTGRFRPTG